MTRFTRDKRAVGTASTAFPGLSGSVVSGGHGSGGRAAGRRWRWQEGAELSPRRVYHRGIAGLDAGTAGGPCSRVRAGGSRGRGAAATADHIPGFAALSVHQARVVRDRRQWRACFMIGARSTTGASRSCFTVRSICCGTTWSGCWMTSAVRTGASEEQSRYSGPSPSEASPHCGHHERAQMPRLRDPLSRGGRSPEQPRLGRPRDQ
jgi:hypothetical protein